jgi:DMSO/TMAO reductase YedYZ heme-binding membrane subunit
MAGMGDLFKLLGQGAILLVAGAALTGLFGAQVRKVLKGPRALKLHKAFGIGALVLGLAHAVMYGILFD